MNDGWFPIGYPFPLSLTIRPQFAIECLRRSNQQGCITLGQNLGRKEVDRQSLGQTRGSRMQQNRVDNFCRLSAMHERDRQTNRQSDHGTPIAIGEIACQRCRLIITIAMRVSALLQFDGIFTNVAVNFTICYKKSSLLRL